MNDQRKTYSIHGPDGYISRVVSVSPDYDITLMLRGDEQAIEGNSVPGGAKVVDGEIQHAPPQPSPFHVLDQATFTWVLDLPRARETARQRITAARNAEEGQGFLAYGKLFDSDAAAVQRILGAAQAAQIVGESFEIEWTCADNSTITLDYAQMIALPAVMADAANAMHVKSRSLKAAIDAAQTIEEINSIQWN